MKKIKIEKNTVQETLIVPLYGRKMCTEKFPTLYSDSFAVDFCNKLDYDFSDLEKKRDNVLYEFGGLEAAMRQLAMRWEIAEHLKIYPKASVVNLGCGLDQTGGVLDNGTCKIYNLDFPDIIKIRTDLMPVGDREENIQTDLRNYSWMEKIDVDGGVIFIAAGVFHYFKTHEVKYLLLEMTGRFPGGRLIFDTVGKLGLSMMKYTLKNMGIEDVKGLFYLKDISMLKNWSNKIKVSDKGYMLGYYDLKEYGIPKIHRLLSKIGDGLLGMRIIRMEFLE